MAKHPVGPHPNAPKTKKPRVGPAPQVPGAFALGVAPHVSGKGKKKVFKQGGGKTRKHRSTKHRGTKKHHSKKHRQTRKH